MPYRRSLAVALVAYLAGLAICIHGPWDHLSKLLYPQKPFHYQSLKGLSDDEIASFMSGASTSDSFHPTGAPETHFPEHLWDTDPKTAALAFADANRTPAHRKLYKLTIDENPSIKPPDAGWLVLDKRRLLTAIHFGTENPLLYHSGKETRFRKYQTPPYNDHATHSLQITPLSSDKARFIAHTVFWLEHIQSECLQKSGMSISTIISTHERTVSLGWFVGNKHLRQFKEILWSSSPIAGRWSNDYDMQISINLTHHLLTEALTKHLDPNRDDNSPATTGEARSMLAERLKPRDDNALRQYHSVIVLSSIARHFESPWPVPVLVNLVEYAGDHGLSKTLPTLEKLNDSSPPELRLPLTRSIRQLHALEQRAQLIELAKGESDVALWALGQLQLSFPGAYSDALISRFRMTKDHGRSTLFETLAAANPPAARRLRDSLTKKEKSELLFEITRFEITDAPARAREHIPELLGILANPNHLKNSIERGDAITLLAKLPLSTSQQAHFEQLLLNELLSSSDDDDYTIHDAASAVTGLPEPDRFWDALYVSASSATNSHHLEALLDALAKLALANPDPRLAQLTDFIRLRFTRHQGSIKNLSLAALALDLRPLAPELTHYATFNAKIPDGENTPKCNGGPEPPCHHRYHAARHVTALWLEPDPDTRARMWNAFLWNSPNEFSKEKTISSCLRERYQSAMNAASPELRSQLITRTRSNPEILRNLPDWLK